MDDEDGGRIGPLQRTDRISRLPDEIREFILGFLPINDAVRTSILSRKWRFSWKRAFQLNLEFGKRHEEYMSKDKYCRLVGKILLSHDGMIHKVIWGPVWHEFDEDGCELDEDGFEMWSDRKGWRYLEEDMTTWLQCLSRKGIKDLSIHFRQGLYIASVRPEDIVKFDPSSSLFHCVGLSCLSLTHCKLRNCIAFAYRGFPNLVRLELREVDIHNDILEKISSSCPLEVLSLDWCNFMDSKTAISAPQLKIFKLVRALPENFPCYLKFAPNLRLASFKMDALDKEAVLLSSNCLDIFRPIPRIEDFTFNCRQHKTSASDIAPQGFPELLCNLRSVALDDFDPGSKDHMSFMLCILRSSPHLQTLVVNMLVEYKPSPQTSKHALKAAKANLKIMDKEGIKTRITKLSLTSGFPFYKQRLIAEVAFFRSIVSCCPVLEKLSIKAPSSVEDSVKLKLSKALKRFCQSSSKPEINYSYTH